MLPTIFVYAGLTAFGLGLLTIIRPLRWIGISTRRRAALFVCVGVVLVAVGWTLPAPTTRVENPRTQLDLFAPAYQFNEVHSIQVNAPPDQVYRAIKEVTVDEIAFAPTLRRVWPGNQPGHESILIEMTTHSSFLLLADEPSHEVVIGKVVLAPRGTRLQRSLLNAGNYSGVNAPGLALATMNLSIEGAASGATTLTTETRVYATDPNAQKAFARYWRVIYPGSALLRRMWLRAIKHRAESHVQH